MIKKWIFKWLGLNDLLVKHKELLESNLRLVEALTRHQNAVLNEYKELRDRVEKLEKRLNDSNRRKV